MQAGLLRQVITIQTRTSTSDAFGQPLVSWVDLLTTRAEITSVSGNEKLRTLQVNSEITHEVTVRYQPAFADPTAMDAWRIKFGARTFNISYAVNVEERNRTMSLMCSEGLNDGS